MSVMLLQGTGDLRHSSRAALSLAPDLGAELERLCTPDGLRFSAFAALYLGVWAALVALVALCDQPWLLLALSALIGSQLHALTVLQHDCGHRSAYRSAAANLWVGRLLAWFVFMPFTTFTELHRRHHGFLGDPAQDPDEWFYEGGARWLFLRECLFMPRFICVSLRRLPAGELRRRVVGELGFNTVTHGALIATLLVLGATQLLLFAYVLPMLWLACVFNPISRGYEHFPMACLAPGDARRRDLRHNTISVTGRVLGVLWANIGFHVEHHMYARVPFYRLPALHRLFTGKRYRAAPYPLHRLRQHANTLGD
jgi:fatty acid desaturase